jgi:Mg2+ and Co2+ transporter CorA
MSQGYLRSMNALATHIREGVANTHDSKSGKYGLPGSLVKSFEHAVMLVVFASRAFRLVDQYCRDFQDNLQDKSRESRYRLPLEAVRDELDLAGSSAILAIERAEQDILLMARTNYHRGVVRYDDVGPEYVLATVMGNLAGRSLIGNKAVDGVYQMLYDRLVNDLTKTERCYLLMCRQYSDVLKHPRAKILRDLFLVREDLRSVGMINKAQRGILRDFQSILEPCTFKATTTTRCSRFTAESHFLENQMRDRSNVAKTLFGLEVRLDDLDTKAWQMLQVNQENHGNAILVFTIVTIIFLPLSWATSYLGMNTSDIRELRQGQGLFWLIGGPLTAVVVIVALLAVLKGEAIREFMIRTESMLESKSQVKKESQNILTANTFMSARKSATLDEKSWVKKRKRRAYPKMK